MSKNNSRADLIAADQNLIDGIQKHQSALPASLLIDGVATTPAQMTSVLQDRITTGKAAIAADNARTAAVAADHAKQTQTQPQVNGYKSVIITMFRSAPDTLGDFGLEAPKRAQLSAQDKAAAAAKAAATRKALGTKGTQQKKAAKAALETAPAVPAPSAVPSAPSAAPAAQASAPAAAPAAPANKGS